MKTRSPKIRLIKDVSLMGYITLPKGAVYEAIRINTRCAYINFDGREIKIYSDSFEKVGKGGKTK